MVSALTPRAVLVNRMVATTRHLYCFLNDRGISVKQKTNDELVLIASKLGYTAGQDVLTAHLRLAAFDQKASAEVERSNEMASTNSLQCRTNTL